MYEQAFRLAHHTTLTALEKQVKCLLAAKTTLSLVVPGWKWVVKPVSGEQGVLKIIPSVEAQNEVNLLLYCLSFCFETFIFFRSPRYSHTIKKSNLFQLKL